VRSWSPWRRVGGRIGMSSVLVLHNIPHRCCPLHLPSVRTRIYREERTGYEERRSGLMIEHNPVNYFLIPLSPPVLSNHTIGPIQVVIQVKLPVHQYVLLLCSSVLVSSFLALHILYLGLEQNGVGIELIVRNSYPLQHTRSQ
jgi:hypothetical protein